MFLFFHKSCLYLFVKSQTSGVSKYPFAFLSFILWYFGVYHVSHSLQFLFDFLAFTYLWQLSFLQMVVALKILSPQRALHSSEGGSVFMIPFSSQAKSILFQGSLQPVSEHGRCITAWSCLLIIDHSDFAHAKLFQLWPTLWDPMNCSLAGSSIHGILQSEILEWVAMPSSKGSSWPRESSWPRDWTHDLALELPFVLAGPVKGMWYVLRFSI